MSSHWLRHVPVKIADRELSADLVVLKLADYDVILGMDFLGKYGVTIDCRRKKVIFHPEGEQMFEYVGSSSGIPKSLIHSLEAKRLISNSCTTYLVYVFDKRQEEKL